jgi:hypothetical protein
MIKMFDSTNLELILGTRRVKDDKCPGELHAHMKMGDGTVNKYKLCQIDDVMRCPYLHPDEDLLLQFQDEGIVQDSRRYKICEYKPGDIK